MNFTWVGVLVVLVPGLDLVQAVVIQRPPAPNIRVWLPHLRHLHGQCRGTPYHRCPCPRACRYDASRPGPTLFSSGRALPPCCSLSCLVGRTQDKAKSNRCCAPHQARVGEQSGLYQHLGILLIQILELAAYLRVLQGHIHGQLEPWAEIRVIVLCPDAGVRSSALQ